MFNFNLTDYCYDCGYVVVDENQYILRCYLSNKTIETEEIPGWCQIRKYTVIFSNNFDIHKIKLCGNVSISKYNRIQNENTCYSLVPIMGMSRGLKFYNQRPNLIIVYEPKVIPKNYYDWLLRIVIPTGARSCRYIHIGDSRNTFDTSKEFGEFIRQQKCLTSISNGRIVET